MSDLVLADVGIEALDAVMSVMTPAFDADYGEAWNEAQLRAMLGLPGVWISLASDTAGRPCGFSLCRIVLDDAELLLIATHPDHRRTGVGAALLDAAIATARHRGATQLHLEVREDNPAIRLYESRGFAVHGRRPRYYRGTGGALRDALTLGLKLGGA